MKKSTLTIGIIAVLGMAYAGTSWYSGNMIEEHIDDQLALITNKVNLSQDLFTFFVTKNHYDKGIFSTKVHLTVTVSPRESTIQGSYPKNLFDDDVTIHHGPFPIAALAKGTFSPQLAWLQYEMSQQANPTLWKLAGNRPFISGHTSVSYDEYITVKLASKAIKASQNEIPTIHDSILDISNGSYTFSSYTDGSDIKAEIKLDKLVFLSDDTHHFNFDDFKLSLKPLTTTEDIDYEFNIGNINYSFDSYLSKGNFNIDNLKSKGRANYKNRNIDEQSSIDKITLNFKSSTPKNESVIIDKIVMSQKNILNDSNNTIEGSLVSRIGSIIYGQQNLGSGSFDIDFKGVGRQFFDPHFETTDPDISESDKHNIEFSLNKLNWHNASGDINVNLLFNISEINSSNTDVENYDKINTLKFNLEAPFDVLASLSAQIQNPNTKQVTSEQIAKESAVIKTNAKMFFSRSPFFIFNKDQTEGIYSNVEYTKGNQSVKVNGQLLDKKDFFGNF
ncbi:MAG: DUF945 family protein [Gilliamella sp.]|uniref:YdgA family protein n=1 Tax=Gilliamella sp. TaxID=1891236 RepID=UPI0025EF2D2C|nr:DUF945 family protein [Gilliamella sp.]MCO6549612.1 DUF945 family protein [Gilliamella sp.]